MIKPPRFSFQPVSPCLKLFIESLLAESGSEISIEQLLVNDEAVARSATFASTAPMALDKSYH